MTWVKLDDGFFRHPKVVRAGRDARDLHLAALCYAGSNLTDGKIPREALTQLLADAGIARASGPKLAAKLVDVGLWEATDHGYLIHDYLSYNPSREDVLREREATRERVNAWRRGRGPSGNASCNGVTTPDVTPHVRDTPSPSPSPSPGPPPAPNNRHPGKEGTEGANLSSARGESAAPALLLSAQEAALWRALAEHVPGGAPASGNAPACVQWRRDVRALIAEGVTPLEVPALVDQARQRWRDGEITPRALARNVPVLRHPRERAPPKARQTLRDKIAMLD